MKLLIIPALLLMASPIKAAVVLPFTYAETYCDLRQLGVSKDDAMSAAVKESLVEGEETYVTLDGDRVGMSTIKAVKRQTQLCPNL